MKPGSGRRILGSCGAVIGSIFLIPYFAAHRTFSYTDVNYQKNYAWIDVEVGTVLRLPQGNPLPTGRCYAIVARKSNRPDVYLYEGPKGELPPKPEFISAQETTVQYRTVDKGVLSFDLGGFASEPSKGP